MKQSLWVARREDEKKSKMTAGILKKNRNADSNGSRSFNEGDTKIRKLSAELPFQLNQQDNKKRYSSFDVEVRYFVDAGTSF